MKTQTPKREALLGPRRYLPLLLIVVGTATFSNNMDGPFIFDDRESIVENISIRQLWPLWRCMTGSRHTAVEGRPVVSLSLAINYAMGKLDVRGYHVVNIAVHILCTLVLFGIVRRTLLCERLRTRFSLDSGGIALSCALIWMVHPLQTECVNYITQRTESIMGLFYLLTLYCAIRAIHSDHRYGWCGASILSCALGMASKEVMVTAPLMVLLYDLAFQDKPFKHTVRKRWGLYLGLTTTWTVLALLMLLYPHAPSVGFSHSISSLSYAMNQCMMLVDYLRLTVWPHPLLLDYGIPRPVAIGEVVPYAVVVVLLLAAALVVHIYRPMIGFLGVWFLVILGPTSSFIPVVTEVGAERRLYLSLAGPIVLAVIAGYILLERAAKRVRSGSRHGTAPSAKGLQRWGGSLLLVLVVIPLIYTSRSRNEAYRNRLSIWQTAVRATPDNPRAHVNLGLAYREQDDSESAIEHWRQALRIDPDYDEAHNNLGTILLEQGKLGEAISHCRQALRIRPDYAQARYNLGNALSSQGKLSEAISYYRGALEIKADWAEAWSNLAIALARQGQPDEAIRCFRQVLQLEPDNAGAHHNLGNALSMTGQIDKALEHYREAWRLRPHHLPPLERMAWILATHPDSRIRKPTEAVHLAERAAALSNHQDAAILDTLATAYAAAGEFNRAVTTAEQAVKLALAANAEELANDIRGRLALYRQRKPYRELP